MTIKKHYEIDDTVWIHGVTRENKLVQGTVIKKFNIDYGNYDKNDTYYVVEIPTHIEPLLEIRQWENISQDEKGPIGMYRSMRNKPVVDKFLQKNGYYSYDLRVSADELEPTEDQIMAALEKSRRVNEHEPLVLKPAGQKRRRFRKKKS